MRGRRPNVERATRLEISIPEPQRVRLDLLLFSPLETRIPVGAYSNFFSARLREFLDWKSLDLAPYTGALPGEHVVRAHPSAIAALQAALHESQSNAQQKV